MDVVAVGYRVIRSGSEFLSAVFYCDGRFLGFSVVGISAGGKRHIGRGERCPGNAEGLFKGSLVEACARDGHLRGVRSGFNIVAVGDGVVRAFLKIASVIAHPDSRFFLPAVVGESLCFKGDGRVSVFQGPDGRCCLPRGHRDLFFFGDLCSVEGDLQDALAGKTAFQGDTGQAVFIRRDGLLSDRDNTR